MVGGSAGSGLRSAGGGRGVTSRGVLWLFQRGNESET